MAEGLEGSGEAAIVEGRYAHVAGNVRTSPETHVTAITLRAVTSADEVSYHMIEVCHHALSVKKGTAGAPATPAPSPVDSVATPMKAAAPGATAAPAPHGAGIL